MNKYTIYTLATTFGGKITQAIKYILEFRIQECILDGSHYTFKYTAVLVPINLEVATAPIIYIKLEEAETYTS